MRMGTRPPNRELNAGGLIAGSSKRRHLLITGGRQRSVYDKKHQHYAKELNLIVRIGKSEAEVTNI